MGSPYFVFNILLKYPMASSSACYAIAILIFLSLLRLVRANVIDCSYQKYPKILGEQL
jgi:hypothetical protein